MIKRGIGHYVVLGLCVLGLVLQPVIVFADSYSLSYSDYLDWLSDLTGYTFQLFSSEDLPSVITGSEYYHSDSIISMFYNSGYPFAFISDLPSNIPVINYSAVFYRSFASSDGLGLTHYFTLDGTWMNISRYMVAVYPPQNVESIVGIYIGGDFSFFYGEHLYRVSNSSSSSPSIPTYPDGSSNTYQPDANYGEVNWPNFVYSLTSWFFYNGIMRTNLPGDTATWNNSNWISIADALTYQFLCQTNFGSSEVTWGNNTFPNYLYQLSDLMYMMDESTGRLADYLEELELEDVGSNLADIKSDLEAAFPAAEVAINDSVADTVLDDSSGSGLTASKIVSAKTDLDDSLSKFSVTLGSDAEFSGVGSALDGQDWSFWSQQTFDNCYMFTFDPFEAQLMDGEDVATQEDSLFKNLLGWD